MDINTDHTIESWNLLWGMSEPQMNEWITETQYIDTKKLKSKKVDSVCMFLCVCLSVLALESTYFDGGN